MDGKVVVYAIFLAVIMAAIGGFFYTIDVDEAQKELILTRQQLSQTEESLKTAKAGLELRKEAAAIITAAHIIERDNETLRNEIRDEKKKRDDLSKVFLNTIERVREDSVGLVLPEVNLTTGTVFKNAKIQSLDSEITVFQHSQGVSKVPTSTLPDSLQDRFRFGYIQRGDVVPDSVPEIPPVQGAPTGKSSSASFRTTASDSLVRLGAEGGPKQPIKKATVLRSSNSNLVNIEGDPGLWNSVERQSIGRAYIPGQGWLKIGAKGPIPGSGRK